MSTPPRTGLKFWRMHTDYPVFGIDIGFMGLGKYSRFIPFISVSFWRWGLDVGWYEE